AQIQPDALRRGLHVYRHRTRTRSTRDEPATHGVLDVTRTRHQPRFDRAGRDGVRLGDALADFRQRPLGIRLLVDEFDLTGDRFNVGVDLIEFRLFLFRDEALAVLLGGPKDLVGLVDQLALLLQQFLFHDLSPAV